MAIDFGCVPECAGERADRSTRSSGGAGRTPSVRPPLQTPSAVIRVGPWRVAIVDDRVGVCRPDRHASGALSPSRQFTPEERKAWTTLMKEIYRQFVSKAAKGRKIDEKGK